MDRIAASVPILPVPLILAALTDGPATRAGLAQRAEGLAERLRANGSVLRLGKAADLLGVGLGKLIARGIVTEDEGVLRVAEGALPLAEFYSASVRQALDRPIPNAAPRQT
jgi:glycerol-3-phosphate O-acyltransferase